MNTVEFMQLENRQVKNPAVGIVFAFTVYSGLFVLCVCIALISLLAVGIGGILR